MTTEELIYLYIFISGVVASFMLTQQESKSSNVLKSKRYSPLKEKIYSAFVMYYILMITWPLVIIANLFRHDN